MYASMLADLICREFKDKHELDNRLGMYISFSISSNAPRSIDNLLSKESSERYPKYDLLIYGDTGVYLRDRFLHPEETSKWFCLAHHDSCWCSAVDSFMHEAEKYIVTWGHFCLDHPFCFKIIEDDLVKELRQARKARYDYGLTREQVLHPLFLNRR